MMVNKKITQAGPKPQDQNITYNTHAHTHTHTHTHTDRSLHVAVFLCGWTGYLNVYCSFTHCFVLTATLKPQLLQFNAEIKGWYHLFYDV